MQTTNEATAAKMALVDAIEEMAQRFGDALAELSQPHTTSIHEWYVRAADRRMAAIRWLATAVARR
jgi:hypothetical protein